MQSYFSFGRSSCGESSTKKGCLTDDITEPDVMVVNSFFLIIHTTVLDSWWRLPWMQRPGWILHLHASSPACSGILRFTSDVTPSDLLKANIVPHSLLCDFLRTVHGHHRSVSNFGNLFGWGGSRIPRRRRALILQEEGGNIQFWTYVFLQNFYLARWHLWSVEYFNEVNFDWPGCITSFVLVSARLTIFFQNLHEIYSPLDLPL